MAEDKINSLFDVGQIMAEMQNIADGLNTIINARNSLANQATSLFNAAQLSQDAQNIQQINTQLKEFQTNANNANASVKELNETQSKIKQSQENIVAATGSYNELKNKIKELKAEYANMDMGSKAAKDAQNEIFKLNSELKNANREMRGLSNREVGREMKRMINGAAEAATGLALMLGSSKEEAEEFSKEFKSALSIMLMAEGAMKSFEAAVVLSKWATMQLNAAMAANPISVVLVAATALSAVILGLVSYINDDTDAMDDFNKSMENISVEGLEDVKKITKEISELTVQLTLDYKLAFKQISQDQYDYAQKGLKTQKTYYELYYEASFKANKRLTENENARVEAVKKLEEEKNKELLQTSEGRYVDMTYLNEKYAGKEKEVNERASAMAATIISEKNKIIKTIQDAHYKQDQVDLQNYYDKKDKKEEEEAKKTAKTKTDEYTANEQVIQQLKLVNAGLGTGTENLKKYNEAKITYLETLEQLNKLEKDSQEYADKKAVAVKIREKAETEYTSALKKEIKARKDDTTKGLVGLDKMAKDFSKLKVEYAQKAEKDIEEINKKELENAKAVAAAEWELANKTANGIFEINSNALDQKLMDLQDEQDADEAAKEKELSNANLTQQQKDAIEEKYDNIAKQREAERKKIEHDKAVAKKAQTIFNIILDTAKGIMAALGEANPVLAGIIGATGAVELGVAMTQPIPKYAKGRDGGKAEMAIVGEAGRELRIFGNEVSLTPDTPTLTFLREGEKIIPNDKLVSLG